MIVIKDERQCEIKNKRRLKRNRILKYNIRRKSTKVTVTIILAASLLCSIRVYNSKMAVAANSGVKAAGAVKVSKQNKIVKTINAVLDKDGNRNYSFKYTAGDFHITGQKSVSYDTFTIDGIDKKDVNIEKNGNDYVIKYKNGSITIDNYYTNNKIENIYFSSDPRKQQSEVQQNLYKYLSDKKNCEYLYKNAVKLNGGETSDTCVFFVSEALRKQKENIGKSVCYTGRYKGDIAHSNSLIYNLLNDGWKIDYNAEDLMPGDLCFSIDILGKDGGFPTHVYTFMGWEKPNSTENAYIVDNQANKYNGEFYHSRNVTASKPRDKFHFFMYKPVQ